jgi:hypothetical protein
MGSLTTPMEFLRPTSPCLSTAEATPAVVFEIVYRHMSEQIYWLPMAVVAGDFWHLKSSYLAFRAKRPCSWQPKIRI